MISFRPAYIPAPYALSVALGCSGFVRKSLLGIHGGRGTGAFSLATTALCAVQNMGEQAIVITPKSLNLEIISATGVNIQRDKLCLITPDTLNEAIELIEAFAPMIEIGAIVALDIDQLKPTDNDIKKIRALIEKAQSVGVIHSHSQTELMNRSSLFHAIIQPKRIHDLSDDAGNVMGWRSTVYIEQNKFPTEYQQPQFEAAFNKDGELYTEFDLLSAALVGGILQIDGNGAIGKNGVKFAGGIDHAISRLREPHIKGRLISAINDLVPLTLL